MVCVIVKTAAVIVVCDLDGIYSSVYPVLLNGCNITSTCTWINRNCKHSMIGQHWAIYCLFVGLLMGTKIGIQAELVSIHLNVIAGDISRLKDENNKDFDYKK